MCARLPGKDLCHRTEVDAVEELSKSVMMTIQALPRHLGKREKRIGNLYLQLQGVGRQRIRRVTMGVELTVLTLDEEFVLLVRIDRFDRVRVRIVVVVRKLRVWLVCH